MNTEKDERMRADAERYRWLRREDPMALAAIAWKYRAARKHSEPDQAVDAAVEELAEFVKQCFRPLS